MFQRLTDQARRVMVLAQQEAGRLDHNWIGTEHLLLGLLHEGQGPAAEALGSLGIGLDTVRQQVEEIIGRGQQAPIAHIPFTPRAKTVLEQALREAGALGHDYVGTEHLLLALIGESDGVAAQVLVALGAGQDRVRRQVIELLPGDHGQDVTGEGPRIDALDRRLAALERWVGLRPDLDDLNREIAQARREKEAAIDRQDFEAATATRDREKQLLGARAAREKEETWTAAGRTSLARELDRVNSELERLRAFLREHGIDPGDGAA